MDMKLVERKYKDAYCIIWFACGCGHQERVWNSRDGIISDSIICSSCGGLASQVKDVGREYDPKHQLNHGQKFFRDGTLEEKKKIIDAIKPSLKQKHSEENLEVAEQFLLKSFPEGWPCIDVHGKLSVF
ncbi:MAG: hypothetical protein GY774_04910 [Planctomycetes bacterium]|nr:hypothetical protein [Planctomycetota bacterium]